MVKNPKERYTRFQLIFDNVRDRRLIAWLVLQTNKCEYIRRLIEADMPKEKSDDIRLLP